MPEREYECAADLIRNLPNPVSIMTPEGVIIDTNLATEKYFRSSREKIVGARIEELYTKEDLQKIRNALEECKRTKSSSCEVTCIRDGKTTFPAVLDFASVKDKKGNVTHIITTATDLSELTELRKQEAELKRAKLFSDLIIDSSTVPIGVTDRDWRWIRVNSAFENLFGYKAGEVLGKSGHELPIWIPEEYEKGAKEVTRLLEEEGLGKSIEVETLCKTKDGKDLNILLKEVFLEEEVYKDIGFVAYLIDITELRKREEELQESRQRYYELVEGVNSVIMRMDTEGEITFINRFAEELFGYTRHELIGQNIVGMIVPEMESTGRDLEEMILDIGINPERYKNNVNENMRKNGE
jgi:PAS domain S-box-containing protein